MSQSPSLTSTSYGPPHGRGAELVAPVSDDDRLPDGTTLARDDDDHDGKSAHTKTGHTIRIRVNARGAAYIDGLQCGGVYEAHIKPQWPDAVWPEGTGLSHTSFLFEGMYEIVEGARPVGLDTEAPVDDR
jgi:hypothetical protein